MAFKLFSKDKDPIAFPQEEKQRKLIFAFIGVVLVALLVLYFGFLRSSSPATLPSQPEMLEEPGMVEEPGMIEEPAISSLPFPVVGEGILIEDITKKINFDIDFLEEPYFQDLKIYGEWPLQIEGQGRDNPFLSF